MDKFVLVGIAEIRPIRTLQYRSMRAKTSIRLRNKGHGQCHVPWFQALTLVRLFFSVSRSLA
jgi:hypothetical protein